MASCAVHPEFEATGRCTRCGRATCAACARALDGQPYCAECEAELARKLAARQASTPTSPTAPVAIPPPPAGAAPFGQESTEGGDGRPAEAFPPPSPATNRPLEPPPGMARPLLFALAAGVVGAFAWYLSVRVSDMKLGLVAIGVGWLVGRAAVLGGGGRGSSGVAAGSVAVALGAMLFGEYLIVNHFLHAAFAAEMPDATVPAYIGLPAFFSIYGETVGIMDVVFYAIGAYEAWKQPAKAAG